jgi:hypothetical protein
MLRIIRQKETRQLQCLQDPSEINGDNLNNIRREVSRHFRNKKRKYLKDEIDELATNSKKKNIIHLYRRINEFNRGYQPRRNLAKDENAGLLADRDGRPPHNKLPQQQEDSRQP